MLYDSLSERLGIQRPVNAYKLLRDGKDVPLPTEMSVEDAAQVARDVGIDVEILRRGTTYILHPLQ